MNVPNASEKPVTVLRSIGVLCRIIRWFVRRDLTKALAAIENANTAEKYMPEQVKRNLEIAYAQIYAARLQMRHKRWN